MPFFLEYRTTSWKKYDVYSSSPMLCRLCGTKVIIWPREMALTALFSIKQRFILYHPQDACHASLRDLHMMGNNFIKTKTRVMFGFRSCSSFVYIQTSDHAKVYLEVLKVAGGTRLPLLTSHGIRGYSVLSFQRPSNHFDCKPSFSIFSFFFCGVPA